MSANATTTRMRPADETVGFGIFQFVRYANRLALTVLSVVLYSSTR
jgi:hypothetical protein